MKGRTLFLAVLKQKCCQAELYRGLPPGTGEQQVGAVRGSISMARRVRELDFQDPHGPANLHNFAYSGASPLCMVSGLGILGEMHTV